MQDDESRVHETVKTVYPYETGESAICDFVRAIAADVYFDKKKEFENDRSGADVYLQNHAGNSSYAVAFTEGGKKYWMVHTGYDALPSCISGVSLSVERPAHQCCCGERLIGFNLDEK